MNSAKSENHWKPLGGNQEVYIDRPPLRARFCWRWFLTYRVNICKHTRGSSLWKKKHTFFEVRGFHLENMRSYDGKEGDPSRQNGTMVATVKMSQPKVAQYWIKLLVGNVNLMNSWGWRPSLLDTKKRRVWYSLLGWRPQGDATLASIRPWNRVPKPRPRCEQVDSWSRKKDAELEQVACVLLQTLSTFALHLQGFCIEKKHNYFFLPFSVSIVRPTQEQLPFDERTRVWWVLSSVMICFLRWICSLLWLSPFERHTLRAKLHSVKSYKMQTEKSWKNSLLLGTKGIATRSKDTPGLSTRSNVCYLEQRKS